jgi:transcriptional regulator with XRE-family HTH domain
MAGLIRQGHFLGAKLRSLRKRNGLTLDELSARCVQIDAGGAPSVSYLSMVETGKRMPSAEMLEMLAGIFSKDARWFLDENTSIEAAPTPPQRGGLEAMPLEPAFLFSHELLQNALPELLSQTGTTGRQFAQLLIRVWQETRHNNFPDIERAAEECGGRQMPLTLNAVMAICERHGLQIKWFDGDGRKPSGALVRSRFEAPATVLINKRLRGQEERLKYELAFFVGHKILHNGDGMISPHSAAQAGDGESPGSAGGMGAQDVLYAWRDFECSFFAGALLCPRIPFRRFLIRESHSVNACHKVGVTPALVMRRMTAVSPYRHPASLGQHELGFRSLPALGRIPAAADAGCALGADAQIADLSHAGRQARTPVLLSFAADPRCPGRAARLIRRGGPAAGVGCAGV